MTLTHVFETHLHNDYVTGGLALARETGAAYLLNADDSVDFDRSGLRDGDVVEVGERMRVRAVLTRATPTRTWPSCWSRTASGPSSPAGRCSTDPRAARTLIAPEHTNALVRDQWRSARRLADELADETPVYPTHGFGSFCSATQSDADSSTIGEERLSNPALTQDEESYARELLAGLDEFPTYYAHMMPANAAGPAAPDLSTPEVAEPNELRRRIDSGEWLVDLRTRSAFAAGHLGGSVNFGTDGQFVTYLGWILPYDVPLTLLGETPDQVADAQRELARIGWRKPEAMATGKPEDWAAGETLASFAVTDFPGLATALRDEPDADRVVLDVRRASEFDDGHIDGAVNLPIHTVLTHLDSIPRKPLWVHCAGGYRASVVAGLLDAHGFDVVAVDDSFDNAAPAGVPMA